MDVFETLDRHRSIRQFTGDDVDAETVKSVVERAMNGSSTSGNLSTYSVIVTRDQARKDELRTFHENQSMISDAPVVLTFLADCNRLRKWLHASGAKDGFNEFKSFVVAAFDAIILAQSVALGFESMGLGICYMGTTLDGIDRISRFFELPQTVIPVTTLAVGHPAEAPERRRRIPVESVMHEETYHDYLPADIVAHHRLKEELGWERLTSNPEMAGLLVEHDIANLAQYYVSDIKYAPSENEASTERLIATLERQDFFRSFRDRLSGGRVADLDE